MQELQSLKSAHAAELESLRKQSEERGSTFSIQHQKPAPAAAARPPGLPEPTGVVERFCVDGYATEVTRLQREMTNMKRESEQLRQKNDQYKEHLNRIRAERDKFWAELNGLDNRAVESTAPAKPKTPTQVSAALCTAYCTS